MKQTPESIDPSQRETHHIEGSEEDQSSNKGREVKHLFVKFQTPGRGFLQTAERGAESENIAVRNPNCEEIKLRMELPSVLDINQTSQIESNPVRLKDGVSGGENGNDEVE